MTETKHENLEFWAVLELMGHRRLAGYVREATIAGAGFIRIDVPSEGGMIRATQFYSPASVYAITPVSEETAHSLAAICDPSPVQPWELPARLEPAPRVQSDPCDEEEPLPEW